MHERLLKQKSIDQHILTQFTGKTNQSYESFISQFDYKNDDTVQIKESNEVKINRMLSSIQTKEIQFQSINKSKHSTQEYKDELETIDLDKIECKKHGFWSNNQNAIIITKFDNFIPEEKIEQSEAICTSEFDEFINSIKESYVPRAVTENLEETLSLPARKTEAELKETNEIKFIEFPGEIPEENTDNLCNSFNLRRLDLITSEQKNVLSNNDVNSDLVEVFQLETDYDYSQNIYKSRYDFITNKI